MPKPEPSGLVRVRLAFQSGTHCDYRFEAQTPDKLLVDWRQALITPQLGLQTYRYYYGDDRWAEVTMNVAALERIERQND